MRLLRPFFWWLGVAMIAVLPAVAVVGFVGAGTASAQTLCTDRAAVTARLEELYGEVQVATALAANGAAVEVWAAPGGGWTMLVVDPSGRACLLASGEGWSGVSAIPRKSQAH